MSGSIVPVATVEPVTVALLQRPAVVLPVGRREAEGASCVPRAGHDLVGGIDRGPRSNQPVHHLVMAP